MSTSYEGSVYFRALVVPDLSHIDLSSEPARRDAQVGILLFVLRFLAVACILGLAHDVWEYVAYRDGVFRWPSWFAQARSSDGQQGSAKGRCLRALHSTSAAADQRRRQQRKRATSKTVSSAAGPGAFFTYLYIVALTLVNVAYDMVMSLMDIVSWSIFVREISIIALVYFFNDDKVKCKTKITMEFAGSDAKYGGECGTIVWRRTSRSAKLLWSLVAMYVQRFAMYVVPAIGAVIAAISATVYWLRSQYIAARRSKRPWFTLSAFCAILCVIFCGSMLSAVFPSGSQCASARPYTIELQHPAGRVPLSIHGSESVHDIFLRAKTFTTVGRLVNGLESSSLYFLVGGKGKGAQQKYVPTSGPRSRLTALECGLVPKRRIQLVFNSLCGGGSDSEGEQKNIRPDRRPELCRCTKTRCTLKLNRVRNSGVVQQHMSECGLPYEYVEYVPPVVEEGDMDLALVVDAKNRKRDKCPENCQAMCGHHKRDESDGDESESDVVAAGGPPSDHSSDSDSSDSGSDSSGSDSSGSGSDSSGSDSSGSGKEGGASEGDSQVRMHGVVYFSIVCMR
jgi:uncharacterized membrane protein YgcG